MRLLSSDSPYSHIVRYAQELFSDFVRFFQRGRTKRRRQPQGRRCRIPWPRQARPYGASAWPFDLPDPWHFEHVIQRVPSATDHPQLSFVVPRHVAHSPVFASHAATYSAFSRKDTYTVRLVAGSILFQSWFPLLLPRVLSGATAPMTSTISAFCGCSGRHLYEYGDQSSPIPAFSRAHSSKSSMFRSWLVIGKLNKRLVVNRREHRSWNRVSAAAVPQLQRSANTRSSLSVCGLRGFAPCFGFVIQFASEAFETTVGRPGKTSSLAPNQPVQRMSFPLGSLASRPCSGSVWSIRSIRIYRSSLTFPLA